jgi:hypothetical protein
MKITFEHTDTFNGEANYCWVKRETFTHEKELSDLALVRRAKAFAGFTGIRCCVEHWEDTIAIFPNNLCQVVFITFDYD